MAQRSSTSNHSILHAYFTNISPGLYGICAANTYLALHPEANIKVLDSDDDVGGVWSTSRLYPQFWSQTGQRLAGFADEPFKVPDGGETFHDLFEAKHLSKYLQDYVSDKDYVGKSLRERFVFRCWVRRVGKDGDMWRVEARLEDRDVIYRSRKLIVATGLSSTPSMPSLPGRDSFKGPILHQKDFGRSQILTPNEPNKDQHTHITVLGGSKSAADIAYAAATTTDPPRQVTWIIRASGTGPLLLSHPKGFGKFRNLMETGSTRALASLSSANPFVAESWWSWFLHKTAVGEWVLEKVWGKSEKDSAANADFYRREGRLEGFEGLESEVRMRWRSGPVGILQREDFWDVIARKVWVYRKDVKELREDKVVLEDGTEVRTDLLLCATGWVQDHPLFSAEQASRLGLPVKIEHEKLVREEREHWSRLEEEGDRKVLTRWPYLAQAPQVKKQPPSSTSYKLYNMIVPPADQSIVFLGLILVPNSYHTSLAQTLYAIAVLDGTLKLQSRGEMEENIAFMNRWNARRYPGTGHLGNVLDFEMVSYTDHLLAQLALSSHRQKGSNWKDLTDPVLASDYAGLVEEYRRKYQSKHIS